MEKIEDLKLIISIYILVYNIDVVVTGYSTEPMIKILLFYIVVCTNIGRKNIKKWVWKKHQYGLTSEEIKIIEDSLDD